jgi:hypothetical protein
MMTCSTSLGALALALAAMAQAQPAAGQAADSAEVNTYRFGGTYARVAAETPAVCAALCNEEHVCEAWSHAARTLQGPPMCELKSVHGRAETRPGYTSGIAGFHQVGALRNELGASAQPDRRATAVLGPGARSQAVGETYRPVSGGIEVDELLGASNRALAPPARQPARASSPARVLADPYAPKSVRVSTGLSGKLSSGASSYQAPSNQYSPPPSRRMGASAPGSSSSSSGSGQMIQARPTTNTKPANFYEDD